MAQAEVYRDIIEPNAKPGAAILFAHGFSIIYGRIKPRADMDVILVAPKGPGDLVRREFQRGRTVTLSLHRPPSIETLRGIAGVSTVDEDGDGRFRIRFAPDVDPTAALVARAGAEDWGLHQLTPAQTSLEDVFVHLTRGDSAGDSKQ